jgi:hypothetical protein
VDTTQVYSRPGKEYNTVKPGTVTQMYSKSAEPLITFLVRFIYRWGEYTDGGSVRYSYNGLIKKSIRTQNIVDVSPKR